MFYKFSISTTLNKIINYLSMSCRWQFLFILFIAPALGFTQVINSTPPLPSAPYTSSAPPPFAPNVILIIGDGMDDHQISIARNYLKGANGKLLLDTMPLRSSVQVLTVSDKDPSKSLYVADSANSASAMATGYVTSRGRIATAAKSSAALTTIIEMAEKAGLRTGLVTTSSVTDATPASFIAHIDKRFCENPSLMVGALAYDRFPIDCEPYTKAKGGPGSISEQLADSNVDVILGGGLKHFDVAIEDGSQTVVQSAEAQGFVVVTERDQLLNVPADKKLLGLFAPSTLPTRFRGEDDRIAEKPKRSFINRLYKYMGKVTLPEPMRCESNPKFKGIPPLKMMTDVALNRLHNDQGFFLMIESASIDKQAHQRNACGSIGEVEQLEEALKSALDYAEKSPNTLIMITADHGQAAQIISQISMYADPRFGNMPIATPGAVARLITIDNEIMGVNYATNNGYSEEHTGVNIPLFANANGVGLVPTMIQQQDLFAIMVKFLRL